MRSSVSFRQPCVAVASPAPWARYGAAWGRGAEAAVERRAMHPELLHDLAG